MIDRAKIFENQSKVEIKKMDEDIIIEHSESESISAQEEKEEIFRVYEPYDKTHHLAKYSEKKV